LSCLLYLKHWPMSSANLAVILIQGGLVTAVDNLTAIM
jgi:hypothetical protein